MKKILGSDKKLRAILEKSSKKAFILKSLLRNSNLFSLVRWRAALKLMSLNSKGSKASLSARCQVSYNKKRFNNRTYLSRYELLKEIRSGSISGLKKAVW